MNPAERLRAVTRRAPDDDLLAVEAAGALAGFADDPAGLVVACRRLVAHHRAHGPLWWVAARVLAAPDARAACREAVRLLDADRTADRLAASLPLTAEDDVVAVLGWPRAADRALAERADLAVVALRIEGVDADAAARHGTRAGVAVLDPERALARRIACLLVPAAAIGAGRALVPAGTTEALATLGPVTTESWLLGGVGRVLPGRLYEAVERAAAAGSGDTPQACPPPEVVSLDRFDRVAGPRGAEPSAEADARADCPVTPELLRPL